MDSHSEARLKRLIAVLFSVCFFLLHTILTSVLQPEFPWTAFLIFAFGFIYQGVEYFLTISSGPDRRPPFRTGELVCCALIWPQIGFWLAGAFNVSGQGSDLFATARCVLFILIYRIVRALVSLSRR